MFTGNMTAPRVRVSHVGIAVPSIDAALPFYRDVLGLAPGRPETADGATIVGLTLGDVQVELLEPRDAAGPVAKFLAKRGPGIHHVCYRVPDLDRLKALWGTERGPASGWMKYEELKQRLTVLQIYLNHVGYRVIEGPLPVPAKDDRRMFRIELQRANSCSVVVPIELAHAKDGRWLVVGTDLAAVGNPAEPCKR